MYQYMKNRRASQGFTLIEVLVAVVVVSLGMLGIAATLFASARSATSGYTRQIAVQYAYDIIDRMRANQVEAAQAGGPYTATISTTAPSSSPSENCLDTTCTAAEMAAYDVWDWETQLWKNLPQGSGSVTIAAGSNDTYTVTVTVTWNDAAGTSAFAQGSGGYSSSSTTGTNLGSYTVVTSLTPVL
jgi:type IV pilus assembly protein PilV